MIDWLTELAKVSGTEPTKTETRGHGTYPFPGTNDIDSIKLKDFPAYSEFPWAKGLRGGARLFKVVYDNVNTRKIEVMLGTPAKELIKNGNGEVIGLFAEHGGKPLRVRARKGVILACGGYENDDAMNRATIRSWLTFRVRGAFLSVLLNPIVRRDDWTPLLGQRSSQSSLYLIAFLSVSKVPGK